LFDAVRIRFTKQASGGHGSVLGSVTGVTTFGIASVQWWFRFGRRCLQSFSVVPESGIEGAVASRAEASTILAVIRGLML
jgi:hypothetical protein